MPSKAIYRCEGCGKTYTSQTAPRGQFCCNRKLVREEPARAASLPKLSIPNSTPALPPDAPANLVFPTEKEFAVAPPTAYSARDFSLVEVIPPRENLKDALAVDSMMRSLRPDAPFALCIAGEKDGIRYYVRAHTTAKPHIVRQLQSAYDQISIVPIPAENDPAGCGDRGSSVVMLAEGTLRREWILPLRMLKDGEFLVADPNQTLLGAFAQLEPGERAAAELVLVPAPEKLADKFAGSQRQMEMQFTGDGTLVSGARMEQQAFAGGAFVSLLMLFACGLLQYVHQDWLMLGLVTLFGLVVVAGIVVAAAVLHRRGNVDPRMVQRKMEAPPFDASLRLIVVAATPERARARLRDLAQAYGIFSQTNGNSWVFRPAIFTPQILNLPRWGLLQEFMNQVTRLNATEIAGMWHLPVGEGTQMVSRAMTKRLLPPKASAVAEGILIGYSRHHDEQIPVHLPKEELYHHTFIVAKTQQGKSTLMSQMIKAALEENAALVVIDPHSDLAQLTKTLVPRSRVGDVVLVDFSNTSQVVGVNLLDVTLGSGIDQIVSNLVNMGKLLWPDTWGPRMEACFRYGALTLLHANVARVEQGLAQYTILDIPVLFEIESARKGILDRYVRNEDVHRWWTGFYDPKTPQMQSEMVTPVLTKLQRFASHSVIRNIVGQSQSTVNFRDVVQDRKILLVNTATGILGPDAGGLLGSMIIDRVNFAVREQIKFVDRNERRKVVIVIDEFQSIPGVDYPALLGELQKMGASFILATQGLGQLGSPSKESGKLEGVILSNISTLVVFQSNAEDADFLRHELDEAVEGTDIINLRGHSCYVKMNQGLDRLPVIHIETMPPIQGDESIGQQIDGMMLRYTQAAKHVENLRAQFEEKEYGAANANDTAKDLAAKNLANQSRFNRKPKGSGAGGSPADGAGADTASRAPGKQPVLGLVPPDKPLPQGIGEPGSKEERYNTRYNIRGGAGVYQTDLDPNAPDPLAAPDTLVVNGHTKGDPSAPSQVPSNSAAGEGNGGAPSDAGAPSPAANEPASTPPSTAVPPLQEKRLEDSRQRRRRK